MQLDNSDDIVQIEKLDVLLVDNKGKPTEAYVLATSNATSRRLESLRVVVPPKEITVSSENLDGMD